MAYRGRPQHEGASTGELLPQAPATAAAEGGEAAQAAGEEGEGVGGISTEATQEGGNGSKVGILLHIHTTHTPVMKVMWDEIKKIATGEHTLIQLVVTAVMLCFYIPLSIADRRHVCDLFL